MNNSVNWYIATKGVLLWNQLVFEFLQIWMVNFCEKFKIIHFLIITAKELRCIKMWAQFGFTLWTKCEVYISSSHPGFRWVILPWCDINPMGRRNMTHPHMSSVFLYLLTAKFSGSVLAATQGGVEECVGGLWRRWADSEDRALTVPAGPRPIWPWAELFSVTFYWEQPPDTHTAGWAGLPSDTHRRASRYKHMTTLQNGASGTVKRPFLEEYFGKERNLFPWCWSWESHSKDKQRIK